MHIDHGRLCVCLSIAAFPHYCAGPDVTWGMVGVPFSCSLLGGFAIGARVSFKNCSYEQFLKLTVGLRLRFI